MKKRIIALVLASAMVLSMAGCGSKDAATTAPETTETTDTTVTTDTAEATEAPVETKPVELNVTTTFAGEDGNKQNFQDAVKAWCAETGNTVADTSANSDESFRTRIITDFETGSEPDVLFFFNGADANSIVEAGKVISIDDIRAEYPDYASNMDDGKIPASPVDGVKYAVPVNGYWEGMFVNTEILAEAGVTLPGPDYTWDAFLADCQKIKDAGYTPIAAALGSIPHYWWEFAIYNHTTPATHTTVPESVDTEGGKAWVAGMEDVKALYEAGYFPENTLAATDDETFAIFTEGKAAFLVDGSWKVNGIAGAFQSDPEDPSTVDETKLAKYDVTFFPSTGGERKASDLLGGLSMGYYITKKAWDDPDKKAAAVSFVQYMSSDATVLNFAQHTASALKNAPAADETKFNSLQIKAMAMMSKATSVTAVVQDVFNGPCRVSTFDGMPEIVTGKVSAVDAVAEGLTAFAEQ